MGLLLATACLLAPLQGPSPFPASTPIEEGLSPDVVAGLSELVQGFVDSGEVVGAELLVIKNGRTVLHGAFGMRDAEREVPMEPGGVFCVRSMTKPLIGTAIGMLLEEKKIRLDDKVATYLPAFGAESTQGITIEQLLQHSSGLPMSKIIAVDPRSLTSIREVADLGGGAELEFEPGTDFNYSDQGTDTLTALIEVVTGAPAEEFVQARILDPLGMGETTCIMTAGHPLRDRACSAYSGNPGYWSRFWGPEDEALFPIFLGSQGLYSTAVDYAKYLDMWMRKGRGRDGRLIRSSSVRRALRPGPAKRVGGTGFPGLESSYGSLIQLWMSATPADPAGEQARELVAFGHTGSDGTHAWAFPKEKAMVLYFTQSRGTTTGMQVEDKLGELLLSAPFNPIEAAPPLEQHVGYYCEVTENDRYRSIVHHPEGIALEILGKAVVPLIYAGGDRWKLKISPGTVLEFDRSDSGEVTGYHIGDHYEYRFDPEPDLPSADEVAGHIAATHKIDSLASVGCLTLQSEVSLEKQGLSGTRTAWYAAPNSWRIDEVIGDQTSATAFDGDSVRMQVGDKPVEVLSADAAAALSSVGLADRFGDWRKRGETATVIQRIEQTNGDGTKLNVLLVRLGDTSGPATTLYIDEDRWIVGRLDGMTEIPGLGKLGQVIEFGDFREIGGMFIPYQAELELANPMIGKITSTVTEASTAKVMPVGHFRLEVPEQKD